MRFAATPDFSEFAIALSAFSVSVFPEAPFSPATPFSPPSGPPQRLFQGPPAKSKFLAVKFLAVTGGTTINGGVLVPTNADSLGNGNVVINNSGILYVNQQWVLHGLNPYTNPTGIVPGVTNVTVNAGGQIQLDPGNGFANGVTNLYLNGGSVSGGPPDPNPGSSYGGLYLYNGNEQITAGGATASTISASLGLTGNNNTITVDAGSSLNNSGILKDGQWGAGGFIKAGTGAQTLSGANTYSGTTTVTGGMLSLGQVNSNNESSTVSITASAGAKLDLAFIGTDTVGSLFINGVQQPAGNYTSAHASGAFTGGGTLSVTSGPAGYASWKAVNAPTGTPSDDYDGDGVGNGSEYVLGGTKDTNDLSKLPAISTGGANMVFTFQRAQASIDGTTNVAIQVSTNLSTWPVSYNVPGTAQANNPGVTVVKDTSAGFDTVTLTVPRAPDTAKFSRLVVTPAP